jgi:hypothetical protein
MTNIGRLQVSDFGRDSLIVDMYVTRRPASCHFMKVGVYTGSILKGAKPAKSCVYVLLQHLTTTARTASGQNR